MVYRRLVLFLACLLFLIVPLYYVYLYFLEIVQLKGVQKPDVLLITIDTCQAGAVGVYGNPDVYTPFIDGLSKKGTVFPRAYAPIPTTGPSHTTILTGRTPVTHRVFRNAMKYSNQYINLAKVFQDMGYRTAAFVSGYSLVAKVAGLDRGFELYDDSWSAHQLERDAVKTVKACEAWITNRDDRPFFVWLHLFDPHAPYIERRPYIRAIRQGSETVQADHHSEEQIRRYSENVEKALDAGDFMVLVKNPMTTQTDPATLYQNWTAYLSEVSYTDSALSYLKRHLQRSNLWERTLVLLTADHGEGFDHDYFYAHGDRLWESALHVPWIVRFPLSKTGDQIARAFARHEDIFPTLLSISNIQFPIPGLEGVDLKTTIELNLAGANSSWTAIAPPLPRETLSDGLIVAAYNHSFKLIRTVNSDENVLYRISADPGEMTEVSERYPNVRDQLMKQIDHLLDRGRIPDSVVFDPGEIQEEESLRSLGYIQ